MNKIVFCNILAQKTIFKGNKKLSCTLRDISCKAELCTAAKTHPFICQRSFLSKKLEIEETKTTQYSTFFWHNISGLSFFDLQLFQY